ncbi:hypothetical protein AN191_04940 [Loktanella sp. 5RATIMAR09]|nr:hypothetical protein AN191_04940 [Loktanella sp. 5RATIMAR09]
MIFWARHVQGGTRNEDQALPEGLRLFCATDPQGGPARNDLRVRPVNCSLPFVIADRTVWFAAIPVTVSATYQINACADGRWQRGFD